MGKISWKNKENKRRDLWREGMGCLLSKSPDPNCFKPNPNSVYEQMLKRSVIACYEIWAYDPSWDGTGYVGYGDEPTCTCFTREGALKAKRSLENKYPLVLIKPIINVGKTRVITQPTFRNLGIIHMAQHRIESMNNVFENDEDYEDDELPF